MSVTIQVRRDLAANWVSVNPVLNQGEMGLETDTAKVKMGDGTTAWNALAYWNGSGMSVSAGDASIVVTGTALAPVLETGSLDHVANLHPPAADWSNNSHKITSLAPGTAGTDAATWGQLPTPVMPVNLIVPMYQYPTVGNLWTYVNSMSPPAKYVVANVSSGPGSSTDANYTAAINAAVAAGSTVFGYVNTGDGTGTPSLATIQSQVTAWNTLYGVTNIFFDNVATDTGHISFYTTAAGYVSGKKVFNHGAIPASGYAPLADILIVFESPQSSWSAFSPPAWFSSYAPSKLAVVVTAISSRAGMATIMDQARSYGIGNVYLTDQSGGNPYAQLPAWWKAEVEQANASFGNYLAIDAGTNALITGEFPMNQNWSFESGVTPWTGGNGATVAQSSTWAWNGTYSLKVTPNGSTANPLASSETFIGVTGTTAYSASCMINVPGGWSGGAQIGINWYTSASAFISGSFSAIVPVNTGSGNNPAQLEVLNVTSPSNAAYAQIVVQLDGTPANTVIFYVDDAAIYQSTTTSAGKFLRSDGTHTFLSPIASNDLPPVINTPVTITTPTSGYPLVISPDGTATSGDAIVFNSGTAGGNGWFGIYETGNGGLYYGISRNLPSPAGTATVGGYYKGLGIGGGSNSNSDPIFGVLAPGQNQGLGSAAFTVYGGNKIVTYNSTLDDGSGNATLGGWLSAWNMTVANTGHAITGTNAGLDAAFSNTLRLFNNFTGGTTQIVTPNGSTQFYAGGNHVVDIGSTGLAVNGGYQMGVGTGVNTGIGLVLDPGANANKGIVVFQHSSSQTGNLLEVQNYLFSPVLTIGPSGTLTATAPGTGTTGAIVTNDITVKPNSPGISTSASMFLDSGTGQVWEFFNNAGGQFGFFDKTNGLQVFACNDAGGTMGFTPGNTLYLSPSAGGVTINPSAGDVYAAPTAGSINLNAAGSGKVVSLTTTAGDVSFQPTGGAIRLHGLANSMAAQQWARTSINHASSPYSVSTTVDYIIGCDPTAGAITVNLPSLGYDAQAYIIKDETGQAGTNNITIQCPGHTIDGASSYVIAHPYGSVMVYSIGANWSLTLPAIDGTTTDIQPVGVQAAGSTGKLADAGHVHPDLQGGFDNMGSVVGWTMNPLVTATNYKVVSGNAGKLMLWRCVIPVTATTTNFNMYVTTVGNTLANVYACLINASTGAIAFSTANRASDATLTSSAGLWTAPWSSSGTVTAGVYYAGLLIGSATTMPTFLCGREISAALENVGTSAAAGNLRVANYSSSLSALPGSPITISSMVADTGPQWVAIT